MYTKSTLLEDFCKVEARLAPWPDDVLALERIKCYAMAAPLPESVPTMDDEVDTWKAAEYLKCSRSLITQYVAKGFLHPRQRIKGGKRYYRLAEISRLMQQKGMK